VIPTWYGTAQLAGKICFRYLDARPGTWYLAFAVALGEASAISSITLDGEELAASYTVPTASPQSSSIPWVAQYEIRAGSDTQSVSSLLSGISGFDETWPGLCYIVLTIDNEIATPGNLILKVTMTRGTLTDPTGGTGPSEEIQNAVYDVLSNVNIWGIGLSTSDLATANWAAFTTWANGDPGDGGKRYTVNGPIFDRDQWSVIHEMLRHCHSRILRLQGSGELHILYHGAAAETGVTITADDWVSFDSVHCIPVQSRPDRVEAVFAEDGTIVPIPASFGEGDIVEPPHQLPLCDNQSQAYRYAGRFDARRHHPDVRS
jgi:hypothetical protein